MEEETNPEILLRNSIESINDQMKYLEYTINRLEKKQIA